MRFQRAQEHRKRSSDDKDIFVFVLMFLQFFYRPESPVCAVYFSSKTRCGTGPWSEVAPESPALARSLRSEQTGVSGLRSLFLSKMRCGTGPLSGVALESPALARSLRSEQIGVSGVIWLQRLFFVGLIKGPPSSPKSEELLPAHFSSLPHHC